MERYAPGTIGQIGSTNGGTASRGENMASRIENMASRIESDTELVKSMTGRVENIADRIVRHARALGYYEPKAESGQVAPNPAIITLADALRTLDRAIDYASGSLNVFD